MNAAHVSGPVDVEAAHTIAGDAIQVVVAPRKRQKDQVNELFVAAGQVLAQSEKSLAVLAEGIQADRDGFAVRPEDL